MSEQELSKRRQLEVKEINQRIIQEILGDLYRKDKILTQRIEDVGNKKIKVIFRFPAYNRTINKLDHVSMSQMHEAVLEGLYIVVGQAIKNNVTESLIDFQTFQKRKLDMIYFRENFSFRRMLKPDEEAELFFEISEVKEKRLIRYFYSVIVKINGFIKGEVECLLEKDE